MKSILIVACLLFVGNISAQKSLLGDLLWLEAGGVIDTSEDNGGNYEIIDDTKNGYLKIAFTEDGCGCYYETTIAAYKDTAGDYSILKTDWDSCGNRKSFSANKNLLSILPKNMGLHTFLLDAGNHGDIELPALLYLEVSLPHKGIDTQIDLKYVPFGIRVTGEDRLLSFSGYGQPINTTNFGYHDNLRKVIQKFTDSETFNYVVHNEPRNINPFDKEILSELYGSEKTIEDFKSLSALFRMLENYYSVSKHIIYKSIILGWDRKKARFYIKEKIKNEVPQQTFLEFIQQLPFLMAVC